jgi:hypothetical protein
MNFTVFLRRTAKIVFTKSIPHYLILTLIGIYKSVDLTDKANRRKHHAKVRFKGITCP